MKKFCLTFLFSLLMISTATAGFFDPPKGCRGKPPEWKYQLHVTPDANRICRKLGMKGFGIILGCTFWWPDPKRPGEHRFLIVAINRPWVIRHEYGHVNCPWWKH